VRFVLGSEAEAAGELARRLGDDVRVHDRFGTSTVIAEGFTYDIARTRRETYARPGALPDVAPASLDEDLRRRDFTVNSIAITLSRERAGELHAPPRALEDLGARLLRVLHSESFIEDPTRLLRLARYASRLGFTIEPRTRALADQAVRGGALDTLTGSRLGRELRLLAREQDPVSALRALRELRIDGAIDPRFGLDDERLARAALALLPDGARSDRLVLALAGRRLARAELGGLLDSLAFEAPDREMILAGAGAEELGCALECAEAPSQIATAVGDAAPEVVALAGALRAPDAASEWLERLRHIRLTIDGGDLLAAGVPQGPAIGRALGAALSAKLDGRASGRDAELAEALRAAGSTG